MLHRSDRLDSLQDGKLKEIKPAEGQAPPRNHLHWTVQLLAACRKEDMDRLAKLKGKARCTAFYRWAAGRPVCHRSGTIW